MLMSKPELPDAAHTPSTLLLCVAISCPSCGEEAVIIRSRQGADTIACAECASVGVRAAPHRQWAMGLGV